MDLCENRINNLVFDTFLVARLEKVLSIMVCITWVQLAASLVILIFKAVANLMQLLS